MAELKFTPGPWLVREPNPYTATIVKELSPAHVRIIASLIETSEQCVADAHLIAASPTLYTALENLLDRYRDLVSSGDCGFWDAEEETQVKAAVAALASARGEG